MEGTIGFMELFAGSFAPKNWAYCAGQLVDVRSNTALFSILGTTYGGDGRNTFALPDLRSRVAIGAGAGPGLKTRSLGEMAGEENVTLAVAEMPAHIHVVAYSQPLEVASASVNVASAGSSPSPAGQLLGSDGTLLIYGPATGATVNMAPGAVSVGPVTAPQPTAITAAPQGGSLPHSNLQPYLGMNYIICMTGIFPVRN